jgi:hypothetical protein
MIGPVLAWICTGPDGCDDLIVLAVVALIVLVVSGVVVLSAAGFATVWHRERQRGPLSGWRRSGWFVVGALSTAGLLAAATWLALAVSGLVVVPVFAGCVGSVVWAWRERRAAARSRSSAEHAHSDLV